MVRHHPSVAVVEAAVEVAFGAWVKLWCGEGLWREGEAVLAPAVPCQAPILAACMDLLFLHEES